jgi:Na+/H+ antiporter NhaA
VVIIALFYTGQLDTTMLAASAGMLAVLFALNRLGVRALLPYLLAGLVLWAEQRDDDHGAEIVDDGHRRQEDLE